MKQGWEIKKLGDLTEVQSGGTPLRSIKEYWGGDIPWYSSGELNNLYTDEPERKITSLGLDNSNAKKFPKGSLLIGMYDTAALKMSILDREGTFNQAIAGAKPNGSIDLKFVMYAINFIKPQILSQRRGVRQKNLSLEKIKNIPINIPSLPEQQRIVALLDETFAALTKVHANAERNQVNARDVFDAVLQSVQAEKEPLGNLVDIKTGKLNANAAVEDGEYPFFTCAKEVYAIDKYAFDCEAILLAGNNASGDFNVKHYEGKFNAYQRTYVITVNEQKRVLYRWLYYQLLNSLKEFKAQSVGANTKFLKLGMIQNMQILLPPLAEQRAIVQRLDALAAETRRLEEVYQSKQEAVEELRRSVLGKAFSGEL